MSIKKIATHSGNFHLDEIVAITVLRLLNPEAELIRTRDPLEFSKADIRVDVGEAYDTESNTYDHHQKGGAGNRDNGVPYASAGLIWKHFGRELCNSDEAHTMVDEKLIQFVDKIDNGIKDYSKGTYTLYEMIKSLNSAEGDSGFGKALDLLSYITKQEISLANSQHETNTYIRNLLPQFEKKPYIILDRDCPWEQVIVNESDKLYVIYPSTDGRVRMRCVPVEAEGFLSRKTLPESWRGLSGSELVEASGVSGAVFCHKNGFLASAKSVDDAVSLAMKAYSAY
jgi:uncharacterized UPF0160 family protein